MTLYRNGESHEPLSDQQVKFVEFELAVGLATDLLRYGFPLDGSGDVALGAPQPDGSVNPAAVHHDDDTVDVYIEYPSDEELAELLNGHPIEDVLAS